MADAIAFQLVRPGDRTSMGMITAGETPVSPVTVFWVRPGDRTSSKAGGDACAPGQLAGEFACAHRTKWNGMVFVL